MKSIIPGHELLKRSIFYLFLPFTLIAQDAVVLNKTENICISDKSMIREISYEVLINNIKGEEYTKVTLPFNKQVKVSEIKAIISDIDGNTISKLKTSEIKKRSLITDEAFFMDAMQYEFSLRHFRFPYIFRYSYKEVSSEYLYISKWYPFLTPFIDTKNAVLTLTIPKNFEILVNNRIIQQSTPIETDNSLVYNWKYSFNAKPESEIQMPEFNSFLPYVTIVPKKFRYQTNGSFESWMSYGQWQYNINQKLQNLSQTEKDEILLQIKNIPDTIERIKTLFHRLQDQTRYVNISLNNGGMIPVAANLVSETKYGDCKGLSNYFRSMLLIAGIHSVYTDVNAGKNINPIDVKFPSQQFNHVILCVPLKQDTIWLDCTSKGPFGYLGSFTQNRPILLNENEKSAIRYTPALKPDDVLCERHFTVRNDSVGKNIINAKCTYRGDDFENLLYFSKLTNFESNNLLMKHYGLKNVEVEKYNLIYNHRDDKKINLEYLGKAENYIQKAGNDLIIRTIPFELPQFSKPALRKYPVCYNYPVHLMDIQLVETGKKAPEVNPFTDIQINTAFGTYFKSVKIINNQLEITRKLLINAGTYSLKEYPDFYKFIEKVTENERNAVVISQSY